MRPSLYALPPALQVAVLDTNQEPRKKRAKEQCRADVGVDAATVLQKNAKAQQEGANVAQELDWKQRREESRGEEEMEKRGKEKKRWGRTHYKWY